MSRMGPCMCGDTECPSCGPGQRSSTKQGIKAGVEYLVCASLDFLDEKLTVEQRAIAEQIYTLASSLEDTLS